MSSRSILLHPDLISAGTHQVEPTWWLCFVKLCIMPFYLAAAAKQSWRLI